MQLYKKHCFQYNTDEPVLDYFPAIAHNISFLSLLLRCRFFINGGLVNNIGFFSSYSYIFSHGTITLKGIFKMRMKFINCKQSGISNNSALLRILNPPMQILLIPPTKLNVSHLVMTVTIKCNYKYFLS